MVHLTLSKLTKNILDIFNNLNHTTVDLDSIVINQFNKNVDLVTCDKGGFIVGIYENHQWSETIFDIDWDKKFIKRIYEFYPEAII